MKCNNTIMTVWLILSIFSICVFIPAFGRTLLSIIIPSMFQVHDNSIQKGGRLYKYSLLQICNIQIEVGGQYKCSVISGRDSVNSTALITVSDTLPNTEIETTNIDTTTQSANTEIKTTDITTAKIETTNIDTTQSANTEIETTDINTTEIETTVTKTTENANRDTDANNEIKATEIKPTVTETELTETEASEDQTEASEDQTTESTVTSSIFGIANYFLFNIDSLFTPLVSMI